MSADISTAIPDLDDPELCAADHAAVFEALVARSPVDPEVAARVHARAKRITEEIERTHGVLSDEVFQSLIDDEE